MTEKERPGAGLLAHRLPLAARLVKELKRGIEDGQWRGWLPGQRQLGATLCVSRATCGQALDVLERQGWVEQLPGVGTRILARKRHLKYDPSASASIGIIMPHPIASMRTKITVWVDELREQLANRGLRLTVCHSPRLYGPNPSQILAMTVRQQPSACWLLLMTTRAIQEWFARVGLPCLTIGTNYDGIDLPSVGVDLGSVGRHAAATLIAAGHRSLGFLVHRLPGTGAGRLSAGDVRFADGFAAECRRSRHQVAVRVIDHEETFRGTAQALQRCWSGVLPCTGIVVASSHCYLSVVSVLGGVGRRIPENLSLICREDDHFLDFLSPRPARYCGTWELLLKETLANLPRILNGELPSGRRGRSFPRFDAGESIHKLPV